MVGCLSKLFSLSGASSASSVKKGMIMVVVVVVVIILIVVPHRDAEITWNNLYVYLGH